MKKYCFLLVSLFSFIFPKDIIATETYTSCPYRFITLVNPVRSRRLWGDRSLKPIKEQYDILNEKKMPVTWLLQYDVLKDEELVDYIYSFNDDQEKGLFLEISPELTRKAKVIYPSGVPWADPRALFLSGYSRKNRIKLIDSVFSTFKERFGE